MEITKITAKQADFPNRLHKLRKPPNQLYCAGANLATLLNRPCLAIVGSRAATPYGQQITKQIATACARAGVTIVSGLAFGIDGFAHQAALEANGGTIAVLPSGLEHIYPANHQPLAKQILGQGGALVSEYVDNAAPRKHQFIDRNRLIAGLAQAVLITEAAANSGSLHTAQFAASLGRPVLAIPGNVSTPTSQGSNRLIQTGRAAMAIDSNDILAVLGLTAAAARASPRSNNSAEQTILDLIDRGVSSGGAILASSRLDVATFSQSLSMLQIKGYIKTVGGDNWQLES